MAIGESLRDFFIKVTYQVDPSSEEKLKTSLKGTIIQANLFSDALEGFAKTLARGIGNAIDSLQRLSVVAARTNSSVDAIRNMQYAAQKMGIDMHSATNALESFQRQINQNPNFSKYWEDLVPDMKKVTDTSDKLMKVFEFLSKQPRWRAEAYNQKLGLGISPELLDIIMKQFKQYTDAVKEHDKIMKALGVTQDAAARSSFELRQAWTKFGTFFDAFFVRAINTFLPEFTKKLDEIFETANNNRDVFAKAFGFMENFKNYITDVSELTKSMGGLKTVVGGLAFYFGVMHPELAALAIVAKGLTDAAIAIRKIWGGLGDDVWLKGKLTPEEIQEKLENERRKQTHYTGSGLSGSREEMLAQLGMGGRLPTGEKIQTATEQTAKNTADIARSLEQKSLYERMNDAMWRAFAPIRRMMGTEGIGGAEGGGPGAEGGATPGVGGASGGGGYAGAAARMRQMGGGGTGGGGKAGAGGPVDVKKAYDIMKQAGATDEEARTFAAISQAESGGNPNVVNPYGEHSVGLWQINMRAHGTKYGSENDLKDPLTNARAALAIKRARGGYQDWTTWKHGKHLPFMPSASQMAGGGGGSSPVGGGGGGGINPELMSAWNAAAAEYKQMTGKEATISSGARTYEKQAQLYRAYREGRGGIAAPPGTSQHERGFAIDSPQASEMARLGILGRHGLHRPVFEKLGRDAVHVQLLNAGGGGAVASGDGGQTRGGGGSVAERRAQAVSIAASTLGLKEGPDSATLKKFFDGKLDPDEAAFCSQWTSAVMEKAGFKGWGAIATNAANWGRGVSDMSKVEPGMVAVATRGFPAGRVGGHAEIVSAKPWQDAEGKWHFKAYTTGGGGLRGGPHGLGKRLPGEAKSSVLEREELTDSYQFREPTERELKRPLSERHAAFNNSSSNITMQNSNTFNMAGGSPHEAVRVASLVENEHNKAIRQLQKKNTTRVAIPRVT